MVHNVFRLFFINYCYVSFKLDRRVLAHKLRLRVLSTWGEVQGPFSHRLLGRGVLRSRMFIWLSQGYPFPRNHFNDSQLGFLKISCPPFILRT